MSIERPLDHLVLCVRDLDAANASAYRKLVDITGLTGNFSASGVRRFARSVRLRHPPSGLLVIAEESRSQHENRARALRRLRQALYLRLREPLGPAELQPEAFPHGSSERDERVSRRLAVTAAYERLRDAINTTETRFEKLEF